LTYAVGTIAGLRHHPSTLKPTRQHAVISS
jgi:hypothetical protein